MSMRQTGQMSFVEAGLHRREGLNDELDRMAKLIDWSKVEACLSSLNPSRRGAPGYPALLLFKAVLLAQWNGLSDEAMECMLADRLSFQRFCGQDPSRPGPDHSTLWRFREALAVAGIADNVFAEINRQLDGHGLILRKGTLIDATLVEAQAARPKPPKEPPKELAKLADTPTDTAIGNKTTGKITKGKITKGKAAKGKAAKGERPKSLLVNSDIDPDARWTRRGSVLHFGYKGHIGVDQDSGLIRSQSFTSAEVNETMVADDLIMGDEAAVYADKAYDSQARTQQLKDKGIKARIQRRANKHHPLSDRDTRRNKLIGKVRGRVETVFAYFKRIVGYRHVRYFNKMRNAAQFALLCTAYNIYKAARIT
jgi:transposase, IS5 family